MFTLYYIILLYHIVLYFYIIFLYQRLLWRGDRTLLHFNISIEQEAFQLEVGSYCPFTLHLDFKIEQEATQEFENAHSL